MPYRGTLGEVDALARRVAAGLRARGIGPATRSRSSCRTGSRPRRRSTRSRTSARSSCRSCTSTVRRRSATSCARPRVKALVTADRFGHQDFLANLAGMRDDAARSRMGRDRRRPHGRRGRPRDLAFADLVADEPLDEIPAVDPSAPALVAYTSGTTSDPKGVVHSHRTINAEIHQLAAMQDDRGGPAMITGAPVGHGIGMLAALLIPVFRRSEIHLIDVWDPGPRAAGDARRRPVGGPGLDVLPHEPARPSRLRPSSVTCR